MWLYGYVAMWQCGLVAMWQSGPPTPQHTDRLAGWVGSTAGLGAGLGALAELAGQASGAGKAGCSTDGLDGDLAGSLVLDIWLTGIAELAVAAGLTGSDC